MTTVTIELNDYHVKWILEAKAARDRFQAIDVNDPEFDQIYRAYCDQSEQIASMIYMMLEEATK